MLLQPNVRPSCIEPFLTKPTTESGGVRVCGGERRCRFLNVNPKVCEQAEIDIEKTGEDCATAPPCSISKFVPQVAFQMSTLRFASTRRLGEKGDAVDNVNNSVAPCMRHCGVGKCSDRKTHWQGWRRGVSWSFLTQASYLCILRYVSRRKLGGKKAAPSTMSTLSAMTGGATVAASSATRRRRRLRRQRQRRRGMTVGMASVSATVSHSACTADARSSKPAAASTPRRPAIQASPA